jgi:hypothetical protein
MEKFRAALTTARASRRALRALLSMTDAFDGIEDFGHPEEGREAAV